MFQIIHLQQEIHLLQALTEFEKNNFLQQAEIVQETFCSCRHELEITRGEKFDEFHMRSRSELVNSHRRLNSREISVEGLKEWSDNALIPSRKSNTTISADHLDLPLFHGQLGPRSNEKASEPILSKAKSPRGRSISSSKESITGNAFDEKIKNTQSSDNLATHSLSGLARLTLRMKDKLGKGKAGTFRPSKATYDSRSDLTSRSLGDFDQVFGK